MDRQPYQAPVSPVSAGLRSKCPRCGRGKLYSGFLRLAPSCSSCGLDYEFMDSGDGPAVFVILIVGFIVAGAALLVEVAYQPPYWVHAILWLPLVLVLALFMLRPLKSILIALQFRNKAREGRLGHD